MYLIRFKNVINYVVSLNDDIRQCVTRRTVVSYIFPQYLRTSVQIGFNRFLSLNLVSENVFANKKINSFINLDFLFHI